MEEVTTLTGEEINGPSTYLVFVNGLIVGAHANPRELVFKVSTKVIVGDCLSMTQYIIHFRCEDFDGEERSASSFPCISMIFKRQCILHRMVAEFAVPFLSLKMARGRRSNAAKHDFFASNYGSALGRLLLNDSHLAALSKHGAEDDLACSSKQSPMSSKVTLEKLIAEGVIEYVDVSE